MRARSRKSEPINLKRIKDWFVTLLLHLSFYAFIIFVVILFMDYFS